MTITASNSSTYIFLMVSLLFGLPLLTVYYNVDSAFYRSVLGPYLLISVLITVLLLYLSKLNATKSLEGPHSSPSSTFSPKSNVTTSNFVVRFVSISKNIVIVVAGCTIVLFYSVMSLFFSSYPFPPNQELLTSFGEAYILLLIITSVLVFPKILYRLFPILRQVVQDRKYAIMAVTFSLLFAGVYLLLVNQVIVAGYNVQATVPVSLISPVDHYPFVFAMTLGVEQPLLDVVYVPVVIIQLSPQVNLLLVPFEMVFTVIISVLVGSSIALAHYLISNSGLRCSTKGTALSTGGSILGLTATCPTCLVPAFVSVIFGGVTTAELVYSSVYGVVLPPIVSVIALLTSIIYLSRVIRGRTGILQGTLK